MHHPKPPPSWLQRLLEIIVKPKDPPAPKQSPPSGKLTRDLGRNVAQMKERFARSDDFIVREISHRGRLLAVMLYLSGAASEKDAADQIIAPIVRAADLKADQADRSLSVKEAITAAKVTSATTLDDVTDALVNGRCVLFVPGRAEAQVVWVEGWYTRNIESPMSEPTQSGPNDSFNESLSTKISLIRRRLRTENLRFEELTLGTRSNTPVVITYLDNIARDQIIREVRDRLAKIELDSVIDTNYIKELILDDPWSPWPNHLTTERPDRVVAQLLEGQVAILIDGSPWALVVPASIDAFLQSPDDYYLHFYAASFTRLLRWIAAGLGLLMTSLYVALLSYHHELIPTSLIFTILASREQVPLPPFLEALAMEGAFEILREAGLRMPQQIGPALSIVGGLVIGEAAVSAGLVSPLMIVIVGMTAIATFVIPSRDLNNSIRILRFPALFMGGVLGLFGLLVFVMFVVALLLRMRSFGVPLLSPLVPVWTKGLNDSVVRTPWWRQRFRPWHVVKPETIRSQSRGGAPSFGPLKDSDEENDH